MSSNLTLLTPSEYNRTLMMKKDKCDKYDYLVSAVCGVIGGLMDIFLVGTPAKSHLGNWTDTQTNNAVISFAKTLGWKPKAEITSDRAIDFLQKKFVVNYDQQGSRWAEGVENMTMSNHHMMSLGHSPDIVGLFFSILNQFTSTSSFISNGRIVTVNTRTFELQGSNFITKILCGVVNWFGHLMSDVAGSSGAVTRGSGIVIPFFELFGLFNFVKFGRYKEDLATIAVKVFESGYDFRFGLAMGIPVVVTECLIRLFWSMRRHFQYGYPIRDCIPSMNHDTLRVMLIIGNGTLCVIDGFDALIRSGGNMVEFFLHLNLIAWFRFIFLVLKEVFLTLQIGLFLQKNIECYRRMNQALLEYMQQLEKIDISAFRAETEIYNQLISDFEKAETPQQLNQMLLSAYERLGLTKPWEGDFKQHMRNKNTRLVFE